MILRILVTLFILLEIADSLMTMWAVNNGYIELNILVRPIADSWLLLLIKVVPAIIVGTVLIILMDKLRYKHQIITGIVNIGMLSCVTFIGFVVYLNILQLLA